MYRIQIGQRIIGEGHPVFIVAELGYNFSTEEEALRSVDAAAGCGVDALKLQTFRAETVTTRDILFPSAAGGGNQYEEFKRFEISDELHEKIFARARAQGLICFSSPGYFEDVDLLERHGIELYKIGSDDLTNLPFLRYVAEKGKPIIFSSGMATLAEVDDAIRTFHNAGNSQLVLLHCVSNYPIEDPTVVNLRVIDTYRRTFPVLVGYSDHTTSSTAALGAVTLGACVIERHFALSKSMPVPDASFSADPDEMRALVRAIREVEQMVGDGVKRPSASEQQMRIDTRKSIVARTRIAQGEVIRPEHIIVKRPAWGIAPRDWQLVIGRKATHQINEDEVITWDLV